ncbi:GM16956 [Drosophila sechellia]|uniref:GM16956 n=1 Tax=Drosophila sechellia TaxID=7238 RepID=B4IQH3_DROSE|nr:GM23459 [Drosophila sechellia]EDW44946.1 GM16956 [Drosophila sechellia]
MWDRCRLSSATYSQQQRLPFFSLLDSSASDLQAADTKSEEPADIKNIDLDSKWRGDRAYFKEFRAACTETV